MNSIDEIKSVLEECAQIGMNPSDDGDPNSSSNRLSQTLRAHDTKGEKQISVGQAGISCFILVLHLLAQFSNNWQSLNFWVIGALAGLIASSALRFFLAKGDSKRERQLDFVTILDISIFLALIWSYQFAYDHPAGGVLKSPSFMLLTVLVGLRALRFHPRPIIIAGSTASIGWCLIVLMSLSVDGSAAVTHDYTAYLISYKILIGAELEKIVALVALTSFLALATLQARRVLSKAASAAYNATEYANALQESERLFSKAFLVSPYPFAILDPGGGTYLGVNEAWLSTMGYSEEEVLGRTASSLGIWADPGHRARFAVLIKNEGSVRAYHAKVRTKAGEHLDTLISAEYVELDGDARVFMVAEDITELKKAEAQRERQHGQILDAKMTLEDTNNQLVQRTEELEAAQETLVQQERLATLGELTATVSHELRNPLAAIRSSLHLAIQKTKDLELGVDRALERAERNVVRCDGIITDLLGFASEPICEQEQIGGDEWLIATLDGLDVFENVELVKRVSAPEAQLVVAPERIRQAVVNIVENAVQALTDMQEEKTPVLTVRTEVQDENYTVAFEDNGPGMDPEMIAKAFKPLFSTKSYGCGLGLATARKIIEKHGGAIRFESEVGVGTKVTMKLPTKPAQERAA